MNKEREEGSDPSKGNNKRLYIFLAAITLSIIILLSSFIPILISNVIPNILVNPLQVKADVGEEASFQVSLFPLSGQHSPL